MEILAQGPRCYPDVANCCASAAATNDVYGNKQ
jgi:hypothetical protein